MWAVGWPGLCAPPLPVAMPAVAMEWCFQDPVGVDCSAPEPRCIWVAVLRGVSAPGTPKPGQGRPSRAQQRPHQPRAKGRRDGLSSSSENPRPAMGGVAEGVGGAWQGPRTLRLQKNSQGFGFTLRHFIVYPPESALFTQDEENGNGKGLQRSRLEPMDTIFVKNVRERGPAHQAGLCTGDRLVKVNGESVLGKTYSQVIALIQNSESVLELSIMPKDEDVLQLAYSQDAYLRGNDPYSGGARNLPPPPPLCYPPRSKSQPPPAGPPSPPSPSPPFQAHMGQNQLDNWSRWPGSSPGPSSPLDNRSVAVSNSGSNVGWAEGRGVGHSSPAHRTEEIQYGMTLNSLGTTLNSSAMTSGGQQQPAGQTRGRSYSSSSSSGGPLSLSSPPLHAALYGNLGNSHSNAIATAGPPLSSSSNASSARPGGSPWSSPHAQHPQPQTGGPQQPSASRSPRCQQALTNWYYSQGEREMERARERERERHPHPASMPPRHRSFSQDRLGEAHRARHHWPHSASQDTLLVLQSGPGPHGEPYWSYAEWEREGADAYARACSESLLAGRCERYDRHGRCLEPHSHRSLEALGGSPRFERPIWLQQTPPQRSEAAHQRPGNSYGSAQAGRHHQQTHSQQHTPQHHTHLQHQQHTHSQQHTPQHQQHTHSQQHTPQHQQHTHSQQHTPQHQQHTHSQQHTPQRQQHTHSQQHTPQHQQHTHSQQHTPQHQQPTHSQHSPQHPHQPQQAAPQVRRLVAGPGGEEPVGYQSYSPSFLRKTGRILQQAGSFRDPSYTGPHLSWTTPKTPQTPSTSPPEAAPVPAPPPPADAPSLPAVAEDQTYRPTNHERGGAGGEAASFGEVVLRQKPPTGRTRGAQLALRHPHYALPEDASEPPVFSPDPTDDPQEPEGKPPHSRANGSLPAEDDSLASIPYIDEPTSPGADLRACHVPASSVVSSGGQSAAPPINTSPASSPAFSFPLSRLFSQDCSSIKSSRRSSYLLAVTTERSKSCDEGLNAFRDESRVFSRLPKRVKSFFTDGSLDSLGATEEARRSKRHSTSELSSISYSHVRREGWLHYKQIHTEKGKKVGSGMRPWRRLFSVLRSHSLLLYKDKREAVLRGAALGGVAEDEQPISIRGCLVDIAYSETKRKHALRLTTQDFCEYLLQAEDREDMLAWIKVIRENSKTDNEELGISRQALISKKLNDYRKQSPTASKPDSSPRVPRIKPPFLLAKNDNASGAPRSPKPDGKEESGPPKSPWGINIMKKSKKAGPKAFGVRLEDCQPAVNHKFIPLIVEVCCGLVEEMGLEYTGIYRVPGNNAVVSTLQDQLNKGCDINTAEERWQDLNVVSSLLKSFFRKLPEPLFTDDKYNDFIDANRMDSASDRLKTMKKLIKDLPDHYYHTLKFLLGHLKKVADSAEKNKMEPRNLALVFGPTLVRTSEDNMTDMVTHMPDRYKIVETLIQHSTWFFSEEHDKEEKTPVDTEDFQPAPNIDHLLSNIGRTALLGEASDSTNSDSAKSKGSWGSKRDITAKDFLTNLSIMTAVTRKRRKRQNARLLGSSTDDDSEHEPIKALLRGEVEGLGSGGADTAPRAEEEEDEEEEEEEEELEEVAERRERVQEVEEEEEEEVPSMPCAEEEVEAVPPAMLLNEEEEVRSEVKGRTWRGEVDARSIVSGYSTLSTLGRSLASEGRGDDADDERSELVSETDNESGFASRSLTQERPEKQAAAHTQQEGPEEHAPAHTQQERPEKHAPAHTQQERPEKPAHAQPVTQGRPEKQVAAHTQPAPRSFLYTHCKSPTAAPEALASNPLSPEPGEGAPRSSTASTSSFSSASSSSQRLHARPSFNSHRLIQCDTLARRRQRAGGEKAKARSLDLLELPLAPDPPPKNPPPSPAKSPSRLGPGPAAAKPPGEAQSFSPGAAGAGVGPGPLGAPEGSEAGRGGSLAEQVRARLLGSADDLRLVGLRKPLSPETRRKRRAWRRHTVVVSPTETPERPPPLATAAGGNGDSRDPPPAAPAPKTQPRPAEGRDPSQPLPPAARQTPTSRFHQYL